MAARASIAARAANCSAGSRAEHLLERERVVASSPATPSMYASADSADSS